MKTERIATGDDFDVYHCSPQKAAAICRAVRLLELPKLGETVKIYSNISTLALGDYDETATAELGKDSTGYMLVVQKGTKPAATEPSPGTVLPSYQPKRQTFGEEAPLYRGGSLRRRSKAWRRIMRKKNSGRPLTDREHALLDANARAVRAAANHAG